jgi:hypothetical protein
MPLPLKIIGFGVLFIVLGLFSIRTWTAGVLIDNIAHAQSHYSGSAEDALIEMLNDQLAPASDKTHIAIWTLGQLRSEKALPVLKALYLDDEEGITCYGQHDELICQYELHKAIESIEGNMLFSFAYLNE